MTGKQPELGRHHLERVTGIEPALSAWESDRSEPLTTLTWRADAPLVTVMNPMTPWLMARQWPVAVWDCRPSIQRRASVTTLDGAIGACHGSSWTRLGLAR
jgi:hypothetical protein